MTETTKAAAVRQFTQPEPLENIDQIFGSVRAGDIDGWIVLDAQK